ncbi:hypothetical protein EGP64_02915 [bacterium]|nr:hypothetical protein [bacterium]
MICNKCGIQNMNGTKFCVKCGNALVSQTVNQQVYQTTGYQNSSVNPVNNQTQNSVSNSNMGQTMSQQYTNSNVSNPNVNQTVMNQQYQKNYGNTSGITVSECLASSIAFLLKPDSTLKEESSKFDNIKNSMIMTIVVSVLATLFSLIQTMFNVVRVTKYWSSEVKWEFSNLKEINYIKTIGTSLLVWLGIILAIAFIYYVVGLILKKKVNFPKLLGISALSIIPIVICSFVLSPLLSLINTSIGLGITVLGFVYTIVLIYEAMNQEIQLEGNLKYYFNLICFSVIVVSIYLIATKLLASSIIGIDNLLDLF